MISIYIYFLFQIFESGIITFGGDDVGLCPKFSRDSAVRYIAVYWIPTDIKQGNGKIYYRMVDLTDSSVKRNETEIKILIGEINNATNNLRQGDRTNLSLQDITSLIYITWEKMQPTPGTLIVSIIVIFSSFVVIEMNVRSDQSY